MERDETRRVDRSEENRPVRITVVSHLSVGSRSCSARSLRSLTPACGAYITIREINEKEELLLTTRRRRERVARYTIHGEKLEPVVSDGKG